MALTGLLPFSTNLWAAQNTYHRVWNRGIRTQLAWTALEAQAWNSAMEALGEKLGFNSEHIASKLAVAE